MNQARFQDRRDAGRQLAAATAFLKNRHPVVLALPRGGVPVGYEVANALNAPLDVLLVRKIPAPEWSEIGLGAVVDGDPPIQIMNQAVLDHFHPSREYLEQEVQRQLDEMARRRRIYCGGRDPVAVLNRTVLLVDDGAATGSSMKAALRAMAGMQAREVLFALPVAPADTYCSLKEDADDGICLLIPDNFRAVSVYYRDFEQTGDDEVTSLLDAAAQRDFSTENHEEDIMKTIAQVMTHDVTVVGPHDSVRHAAQIMSDWDIGALPVCDGERLLGMITDRDITIRAATSSRSTDEIRIAEVMTDEVSWCFDDQSIHEVLQQMRDQQVRRIPVLDRDMRLVGMVTIGDLASRADADIDDTLKQLSRPSPASGPSAEEEIVRLHRPQSDTADGRF